MNPETTIGTVDNTGADLVPLPSAPLPAAPLPEAVREYVRASKADKTLRGYQTDWRDFCAWCESHGGLCPLPAAADTVAAYISPNAPGT